MKFLILICAALCLTPGCSILSPSSPITHEASVYYSFHDTWAVTRAAYSSFADRYVAGNVSVKDKADVDRAWEAFRSAYLIALEAAQMNGDQFTPDNVKKLSDSVLTLIAAAL